EPIVQVVECPVVGRACVLASYYRNPFVRQRRVNNFFALDQQTPLPDLYRQALAPALPLRNQLDDFLEIRVADAVAGDAPAHPFHGQLQTGVIDRLQEVIRGVDLERLDRVLVVGRDEDDVRRGARGQH